MAEEFSLLEQVKSMIGVTGKYHDKTINGYIEEVRQYLMDGGVKQENVDAPTSAGIIARGVSDLWNYGAGDGRLSPYFKERAIQLSYKMSRKEVHDLYHVSDDEIHNMVQGGR